MKHLKKSTFIPAMLLVYLIVMAFMGRHILKEGEYLEYFGIIIVSLLCIVGLYYTLRAQERARARKQQETEELEQKAREASEQKTTDDTPTPGDNVSKTE